MERQSIQQYLASIKEKHNEAVAQVYSDFLYKLLEVDIDAFVEQSLKNGFEVNVEWVRDYKPHLNL
jgi:hypothetical protein